MSRRQGLLVICLVSTLVSSIGSAGAALAAIPTNDNFAQASPIESLPFNANAQIDEATVENGEVLPCVPPFPYPAQTVWYSFTPSVSGIVAVTAGATFYYQFMAAYRQDGFDLAGLTSVGCSSWIYGNSRFEFGVEAGQTYYIQQGSNFAGTTGTISLAMERISPLPGDDFQDARAIDAVPFVESVNASAASFQALEPVPSCASDLSLETVWYKFTPTFSGSYIARTRFSGIWSSLAVYTGDDLAGLRELGCQLTDYELTFRVEAGTTYYFQVARQAHELGWLNFELVGPPPGDDFANARPIEALPFSDSTDSRAASFETSEPTPTCASGLSLATIWYKFTPTVSGLHRTSAPFSGIWSSLAVYTGADVSGLDEVGCALFGQPLTFRAEAGVTYYFQVARQAPGLGLLNFALDTVPNQLPMGHHDVFSGDVAGPECLAAGWAVDPDDRFQRLAVRISADGSILGETTADDFRQDLIDAGVSPDGLAGFSFDLRGHVSVGEPHTILVEAQDAQTSAWQALDATPRVINCADSPPEGTHDGVGGTQPPWACVANGWAIDPDDRTARLTVRILVDGQVVVSTVADLFRQDLLDAGVSPDGLAGFNINLWGLISHRSPHEIRVQAQDNESGEWFDLDATPMTLRCSVPSPSSGIGFTGHWTATDLDGSALKMVIGPGDTPPVTYYDTSSSHCDNNPYPNWVEAGKGEYFEIWLFVTFNKPGCDPLELQFYWDEGSDTLWEDEDGDGVGVTWYRAAQPPGV